jgi:hypothetical protein
LKDDPRFSEYLRLKNSGIPLLWLETIMQVDSVNPAILELDPNIPYAAQVDDEDSKSLLKTVATDAGSSFDESIQHSGVSGAANHSENVSALSLTEEETVKEDIDETVAVTRSNEAAQPSGEPLGARLATQAASSDEKEPPTLEGPRGNPKTVPTALLAGQKAAIPQNDPKNQKRDAALQTLQRDSKNASNLDLNPGSSADEARDEEGKTTEAKLTEPVALKDDPKYSKYFMVCCIHAFSPVFTHDISSALLHCPYFRCSEGTFL